MYCGTSMNVNVEKGRSLCLGCSWMFWILAWWYAVQVVTEFITLLSNEMQILHRYGFTQCRVGENLRHLQFLYLCSWNIALDFIIWFEWYHWSTTHDSVMSMSSKLWANHNPLPFTSKIPVTLNFSGGTALHPSLGAAGGSYLATCRFRERRCSAKAARLAAGGCWRGAKGLNCCTWGHSGMIYD